MASDKDINKFLDPYHPEVQAVAHELCRIVNDTAPQLNEAVKSGWKNVTYAGKGVVCAVQPYSQYVSLYFYKGTELSDPDGVLEGGGKQLRHVKVHNLTDIDETVLVPLIKQAVALDAA